MLWAAQGDDERMPAMAAALIDDPANTLYFSAASIWEVAIKATLGRSDFQVDPQLLRRGLLDNGYVELAISGDHAAGVGRLPDLHRDPFDRLLVSQAQIEGIVLLTADAKLSGYPGPIQRV